MMLNSHDNGSSSTAGWTTPSSADGLPDGDFPAYQRDPCGLLGEGYQQFYQHRWDGQRPSISTCAGANISSQPKYLFLPATIHLVQDVSAIRDVQGRQLIKKTTYFSGHPPSIDNDT